MRKNNLFNLTFVIVLLLFGFNSICNADENPRVHYSINDEWKFKYFPSEEKLREETSNRTENRETINIPHTWNIDDAPTDTSTYRRGIGWYEKKISLSNELVGKRIFINFEGANQKTELLVNGKKAGIHLGGYTAFTFDITDLLKFDSKENLNIIKVIVNNKFDKTIPPLSADFTFYGGIYRDVWLTAVDPVHISLEDFGSSGIYISTPEVSNSSASVSIKGVVVNKSDENQKLKVENIIYDPSGSKVLSKSSVTDIKAGEHLEFIHSFENINNPHLWSPDSPVQYSVRTNIIISDIVVDVVESSFGFRFFSFDANKGFFLNGKPLKLMGSNRHQDYFGLGNALPDSLHVKDLEMIKDAGFNFLRLAHYPQDPVVLETADRLGLILWEEIPIVNYVTTSEEFKENSKNMLKEMIRQHYNHPSVFFWGYMNEVFLHDANGNREKDNMYFPDDYLQWTTQFAKELNELSIEEDPSRLTTMAIHQGEIYDKIGIANIPQTLGYNLYPGWYFGKMSSMGKFLDEEHEKYPDRKIILSEYGAGSDERIHSYNPFAFDFSTEYQQLFLESYITQILERPFLGVASIWAQNDFGSDRRIDSKPKINQKGLQYFDRREKDIYYLYKAILSSEPVLRIASHDWLVRDSGPAKNSTHSIKIYSNLSEVKIFVNSKFIEIVSIEESNIGSIDLQLPSGEVDIEVVGMLDSQKISDSVKLNVLSSCDNLNEYFKNENYLAVNVGAEYQFIDPSDKLWVNMKKYEKEGWGYLGKNSIQLSTSEVILNSKNDPLFQSALQGLNSFQFDVPTGLYEVELYFAEIELDEANMRVQDISINGKIVCNSFDIVAENGKMTANKKVINVEVGNEGMSIDFTSKKGSTLVNAICINKIELKE